MFASTVEPPPPDRKRWPLRLHLLTQNDPTHHSLRSVIFAQSEWGWCQPRDLSHAKGTYYQPEATAANTSLGLLLGSEASYCARSYLGPALSHSSVPPPPPPAEPALSPGGGGFPLRTTPNPRRPGLTSLGSLLSSTGDSGPSVTTCSLLMGKAASFSDSFSWVHDLHTPRRVG